MKNVLRIVLLTVVVAGIAAAGTTGYAAPELSVGSAATAVGLVAGVLLVIRARRK